MRRAPPQPAPPPRYVLIDRPVRRAMLRHFRVGRDCEENRVEQICALGGRIGRYIVHIRMLVPLQAEYATGGIVKVPAAEWYRAIVALRAEGFVLAGSVHSHPGALPVFASGQDLCTHRQMFPRGAGVVVNPHRKKIAAFDCAGARMLIKWE